ncbi:hypothetical protein BsWGS_08789 [Bradybaena similaris]
MTSDIKDITKVKETVKSIYQLFGDITSIHGVQRTTVKTRWRRIIWAILVLTSFSWGLHQLVIVVDSYFSYPVSSVITLQHGTDIPFPAVTICNLNKLRKSLLPDAVLRDIVSNYTQFDRRITSERYENFIVDTVDLDVRRKAWHNISDMLQFCAFNEERCAVEEFTQVRDNINGHCYTFNREGKAETRYTTRAGPIYGLIVELRIQLEEYLNITNTAGFKVIVHDPQVPPFPEDGGITVQPGQATNIGIEKTIIRRLPQPYENCDESSVNNSNNLYGRWNYTYTENGCKKSCFQMSLYDHCACCLTSLPCNASEIFRMAGKVFHNESIPFCDYQNKKNAACMLKVEDLFKYDKRKCAQSCPPACLETIYTTVVSSGFWPTESYFPILLQLRNRSSETSLNNFSANNLKLYVYYSSLFVNEIETKKEYDTYRVISDVGGQIGLMVGASLLTAVELVELLADILVVYTRGVFSWLFTTKLRLDT